MALNLKKRYIFVAQKQLKTDKTMRKLIALLALVTIAFVACEPIDDPAQSVGLTITSKTEVSISSGSTMGIITYTIDSPIEGATIEAECNVEWINSFNFSQMGKISYKVDANPSYDAREGEVMIKYNNLEAARIVFKQAGKTRPEEVAVEIDYALGHYFGDYANINYNYYLVLSTSNYDANGSFYAAGEKYFLDIYADKRPEDYNNIRVPDGVYTFNPNNDGKAGTFLESYSIYKHYDINGYQVDEKQYSEGKLTVEGDKLTLELVFVGEESNIYVVTYEGDYSMMDKRSEVGAIY